MIELLGIFWAWFRGDHGTSMANMTSIIGFGLTVYVYWAIRGIRKNYMLRARLPELVEKLAQHGQRLSNYLGSPMIGEDDPEMLLEVQKTQHTLINLKANCLEPNVALLLIPWRL